MIYFQDPAQTGKMKAWVEEILSFVSYHLFLCTQLFPTHPGNPSGASPTCGIATVSPKDLLCDLSSEHFHKSW